MVPVGNAEPRVIAGLARPFVWLWLARHNFSLVDLFCYLKLLPLGVQAVLNPLFAALLDSGWPNYYYGQLMTVRELQDVLG